MPGLPPRSSHTHSELILITDHVYPPHRVRCPCRPFCRRIEHAQLPRFTCLENCDGEGHRGCRQGKLARVYRRFLSLSQLLSRLTNPWARAWHRLSRRASRPPKRRRRPSVSNHSSGMRERVPTVRVGVAKDKASEASTVAGQKANQVCMLLFFPAHRLKCPCTPLRPPPEHAKVPETSSAT